MKVLHTQACLINKLIDLKGVTFLNKNILGVLSVLTVAISIIFFFIIRGPNANLTLGINVFTVLSVLGIIFAILSKKLSFIITGILLNGAVLVFVYFLLLAVGISEP